jgi:hypothetical protein
VGIRRSYWGSGKACRTLLGLAFWLWRGLAAGPKSATTGGKGAGGSGAAKNRSPYLQFWYTGCLPNPPGRCPVPTAEPPAHADTNAVATGDSSAAVNRWWLIAVSSGVAQAAKRAAGRPCSNSHKKAARIWRMASLKPNSKIEPVAASIKRH